MAGYEPALRQPAALHRLSLLLHARSWIQPPMMKKHALFPAFPAFSAFSARPLLAATAAALALLSTPTHAQGPVKPAAPNASTAAASGSSTAAGASTPAQQADAFANIFATTCAKYASSLGALRTKLAPLPTMPADKAAYFLQGQPGKVWPVPDPHGSFVVAIPDDQNLCAVYARRVGVPQTVAWFKKMATEAPVPMVARQVKDSKSASPQNGTAHTIAYEWAAPDSTKRVLYSLTTSESPTADLQGLASVTFAP